MRLKITVALVLSVILSNYTSCKKKEEPNKIIDGLPVNSSQKVVPAQAAQQLLLLKRDSLNIIVPVINKLGLANQSFTELSGPDSQSRYSFQITDNSYGTATFTLQFRNSSNAIIDPIKTQTSTTTLNSVVVTGTGNSSKFSYSENLTITLETVGKANSKKFLTGTSNFNGSGTSVTFTFPAPGAESSFQGLIGGGVTGSGTGAGGEATTLSLSFASNHEADGAIAWEGQQGGIHFAEDGKGYIVTNEARLLID